MILKSLVHEPLEENITTRSGPIHKQTDTVHDVGRHLRTASRGKKKNYNKPERANGECNEYSNDVEFWSENVNECRIIIIN